MTTLDESNYVKLVDLVYEAALDGRRWPEFTEALEKLRVRPSCRVHPPGGSQGREHAVASVDCRMPAETLEGELLVSLVPHFQRALLIRTKLAKANISDRLSDAVMARVHFGVILLGSGGSVIRANPVAEALLRDRDVLMQSNSHFAAVDRTANDQLQRAIALAEKSRSSPLNPGPDTVIVQRASGQAALCLLVVPLSTEPIGEGADSVASSIVFVFTETDRPQVEAADLAFVYGISRAEARVAAKLAQGYTLAEIAQCFSLSIETVRTHVKHLLIKLDCRCQAGLMRKILLGPAISLTQIASRC